MAFVPPFCPNPRCDKHKRPCARFYVRFGSFRVACRPEPVARFHTVVSGDNLSRIAKAFYGDANRYALTFEENKPMLTHPDKIYPGQVLRIPQA